MKLRGEKNFRLPIVDFRLIPPSGRGLPRLEGAQGEFAMKAQCMFAVFRG